MIFLPTRRYDSAVLGLDVTWCLSVCHKPQVGVISTDGRSELVFSVESSFDLSDTVLQGNSSICKHQCTPLCRVIKKFKGGRFFLERSVYIR